MKKAFFTSLFLLTSVLVFAQTNLDTMRPECRKIIYAVKPVEAIGRVENIDTLYDYLFRAQEFLNKTDKLLMEYISFLFSVAALGRGHRPAFWHKFEN